MKRRIPLIYFCSNQRKVDPMICFYWSQQNHKLISAVTTVLSRGWLGVFISLLKVIFNKKGNKGTPVNGWKLKMYYTSPVRYDLVAKIAGGGACRYISTGNQSVNARTGSNCKNVCVTHTTATTTQLIKKTTTPQSSNAESTNTHGLWCRWLDNDDTATVMTMQKQAIRDWLASGTIMVGAEQMLHCWWVVHCGFWMRERRRIDDVV